LTAAFREAVESREVRKKEERGMVKVFILLSAYQPWSLPRKMKNFRPLGADMHLSHHYFEWMRTAGGPGDMKFALFTFFGFT
jgi:hypothetical protein